MEEIFKDVLKRISFKYQFLYKKYKCIFNVRKINLNLTLAECGFYNNCNIFLVKLKGIGKKDEDEDIVENITNNL